jgi:hypothetical protein
MKKIISVLILITIICTNLASCSIKSHISNYLDQRKNKTPAVTQHQATPMAKVTLNCQFDIGNTCYVTEQHPAFNLTITPASGTTARLAYYNQHALMLQPSQSTKPVNKPQTYRFHTSKTLFNTKNTSFISISSNNDTQPPSHKKITIKAISPQAITQLCQRNNIRCVSEQHPTFTLRIWPFDDGGYTTSIGKFNRSLLKEESFKHILAQQEPKGMVGSPEQYPSIEYTFKATPKMLQKNTKTKLNLITFQPWDKKNTRQTKSIIIHFINS